MLKETMYKTAGAMLLCATIAGCGNSSKSNEAAEQMVAEAQQCIAAGQPEKAIVIIDSLNSAFPKELALRRKGMHLRTLADSAVIAREFAEADSTISADSVTYLQLKPQFVYVKDKDMVEGYYVDKALKANPLYERTGIEPRVDESGNFMIVSCVFGAAVNHEKLVARASAGQAETSAVPYDEATNYRYKSDRGTCEMITFHQDKCEEFCRFVAENGASQIKVDFIGKGKTSITVTPSLAKAIGDTYRYALALQSGKNASAKKLYLEKKRQLNRQQMASTAADLAK